VTISIALITLAEGNWRSSPRPASRSFVRTANVTDPNRAEAHAAAPATSGCQRSAAVAQAGHRRPASSTAAARRRMASVYAA
jgi:hypothetical protein